MGRDPGLHGEEQDLNLVKQLSFDEDAFQDMHGCATWSPGAFV